MPTWPASTAGSRWPAAPWPGASVITYQDGARELEVLRTGPPHHTEQTIDGDRFTRQHAETLPVAEPPDVQNAVALVRSMLLDDTEP